MRDLVRGDTTTELDRKVKERERNGWRRITTNKLDDSGVGYGNVSWVCVMERDDQKVDKRTWGLRR